MRRLFATAVATASCDAADAALAALAVIAAVALALATTLISAATTAIALAANAPLLLTGHENYIADCCPDLTSCLISSYYEFLCDLMPCNL